MASTEESWPFSNQANDEADWRALVGALSESGALDGLEVTAGSGMQVLVAPGTGFVEGFYYKLSGDPKALTVSAAHATLTRKDYVILKADVAAKTVTMSVKAGTTAGGGTFPSLTNDATTREIALRPLTVPGGASNIVSGNIGDPLSLAPKRVKVYLNEAARPTPTGEDYAIGINLTTKVIEFWNGSAWSGAGVLWSALSGVPATFAPAAHSLDSHTGELSVAKGGTGATTAAGARTNLGAAATAHTHPSTDLSDSGVTGRALLASADSTAARTALAVGSIGSAVMSAATVTAARDALRLFTTTPGAPATGDIRFRAA